MKVLAMPAPLARKERLIRIREVEGVTGLKKSTIYSLMADKQFPPSIRLTGRCVAWPESAVYEWVHQRIAGE